MIGSALRRLALGLLAVLAGAAATESSAGDPRAALFLVTFAHAQRPGAADLTAMLHGSGLRLTAVHIAGVSRDGVFAFFVDPEEPIAESLARVHAQLGQARRDALSIAARLHGRTQLPPAESGLELRGQDGYCGVELQGAAAAMVALQLRHPERVLRVESALPERRPLPRCE